MEYSLHLLLQTSVIQNQMVLRMVWLGTHCIGCSVNQMPKFWDLRQMEHVRSLSNAFLGALGRRPRPGGGPKIINNLGLTPGNFALGLQSGTATVRWVEKFAQAASCPLAQGFQTLTVTVTMEFL